MAHIPRKHERAKNRSNLHIKRISAELDLVPKAGDTATESLEIRILLHDITPKGIGLYTPKLLHKGQEIFVKFAHPTAISIKARVVWALEFNISSHVLSNQAFPYRAGAEFIFQSDDEKANVAKFCEQLMSSS